MIRYILNRFDDDKSLGMCIGRFTSDLSIINSVYRFFIFKYDKPIENPIRYFLSILNLNVLIFDLTNKKFLVKYLCESSNNLM